MRRLLIICTAVAFAACARADDQASDSAMDSAAAAAMPMSLSLFDVAGRWTVRAMPEMGDSTLVTYELNATSEPTGWTVTFPGRDPIPATVRVDADSLFIDIGPYESALRSGVQVTTNSVARLQNGMLTGNFVAHYQTTQPDSVLRGRIEGTRAP